MKKRGQFYLLATIVIIAIAIGIFAASNFSSTNEEPRVHELGKQLQKESQKFLEYYVAGGFSSYSLFESFGKNFSEYAGRDVKILYVYGRTFPSLFIKSFYINESGEISSEGITPISLFDNTWTLEYEENRYKFKFLKGENLFYVITQEIEGEKYVATNANG